MPTLNVRCIGCGNVDVDFSKLNLRLCVDSHTLVCCFSCPSCSLSRELRIWAPHTIALLLEANIPITRWRLPQELFEEKSGLPISHDDVIDFYLAAEDPNIFDAAFHRICRETK